MAKVSGLSQKLSNLDWEFKKLSGRVADIEEGGGSTKRTKSPAQVSTRPVPAAPQPSAPSMEIRQVSRPAAITPSKPSRTREEWESLIGGKILNRIGALALIIGVGFFLKYAFDNNWINETMRVLIGAAAGFLCLAGAYRSHNKGFEVFAQGIVGAGISILYLSVYASFNFYSLVPQWVAFLLMSVVTAVALVQGLYYGSVAVALLGWAGGFLTPIMLSTGEANEVGLFSYVALLSFGLLAIVYKKEKWWVLEPLTFLGTWILYLSWYLEFYTAADLGLTISFIGVFWVLFYALFVLQPAPSGYAEVSRHFVGAFNALILFLALSDVINEDYHDLMGSVTLGLAAIYGVTLLFRSRGRTMERPEQMHFALASIAFLVFVPWVEWREFDVVIAWLIEAGVLVFVSRKWNLRYVMFVAAGIYGLAILRFIATPGSLFALHPDEFALVLNPRAAALLVGAASLIVASRLLTGRVAKKDAWVVTLFNVLWSAALFLFVGLETNDYFRQKMLLVSGEAEELLAFERLMWMGLLWAAYSVPLFWIGIRFKETPVLICALLAALIGAGLALVRGIAFDPIGSFDPVLNARAAALVLVTLFLVIQERLAKSGAGGWDWMPDVRSALQMSVVVLIFGLVTGEVRDVFRKEMLLAGEGAGERLLQLSNLQQLSLSGTWLVYSVVLMVLGLWRKLRALRIAAFVLFGITILKIFLYDLSFLDTLYRIFSFIALGLVLLGVSFAYQRYRDVIFGAKGGGEG